MSEPLPASVSTLVIGAGALGCAIAWQLAARGERDVLVLEKSGITHGSTWHAAGLVGQYRSREDLTRVMQASVAILDEIEARTPIGWRKAGSLRLASSAARLAELTAGETKARRYGVAYDMIEAREAARRFPGLATEGVHGVAWIPGDGYVDPTSLTNAYAARARGLGVRIVEGARVEALERAGDRIAAVRAGGRRIACGRIVIAAGVWARALGRLAGLELPVAALEHQYAVTEKRADIPRDLPALRDPDLNFYLKPEVGAYAVGGWEPETATVHGSIMPAEFGRELLPESLDRLAPILEAASRRIPALTDLGLRQIVNGPIPVTPDGEPILGPAPGLDDTWLAIGFTSGIAASGGAGAALADWMMRGEPPFPMPSLDPDRFGAGALTDAALNARATAAYAGYYALAGG